MKTLLGYLRLLLIAAVVGVGVCYGVYAITHLRPADSANRAKTAAKRGNYALAVKEYTQAMQREPQNPELYANRGVAYRALRQWDKAIADFTTAIHLAEKTPRVETTPLAQLYDQRGYIYTEIGKEAEAAQDFARTISLKPNGSTAYNQLAWLRATSTNAALRNGAEAIRLAKRACDLTGWKNPMILDTLAAAYAETGDFPQAVRWQQHAMSLAPEKERAQYTGRLALYQQGKPYRESRASMHAPVP